MKGTDSVDNRWLRGRIEKIQQGSDRL